MAPCGLCKDSIKYMWHTFFRRKATTSDITDMSAHTFVRLSVRSLLFEAIAPGRIVSI